ncbi:MAG: DUF4303 domain-containing protein [Polyangiaceae bacterium]
MNRLVELTAAVTRDAITDLFRAHASEHFYYVSLVCSWAPPFLSAWSVEALARAAQAQSCDPLMLKWSYADSPYCAYRQDLFDGLREHFESHCSSLHAEANDRVELAVRVAELVMARLDSEGLFGKGVARNQIVVGAEVMPPDWTNTERLQRLNPDAALYDWLQEAAEPCPD